MTISCTRAIRRLGAALLRHDEAERAFHRADATRPYGHPDEARAKAALREAERIRDEAAATVEQLARKLAAAEKEVADEH